MTEQQQVAMIQTFLYFAGKQAYNPNSQTVTAILREAQSGAINATKTWDVSANKAPTTPAPTTKGWNLNSNKAV